VLCKMLPESRENLKGGPWSAGGAAYAVESNPMTIRACTNEDLVQIAKIHKIQFSTPDSLSGRASVALVAAIYEEFLDRSIFLVHTSGGFVDGFVLGGSSRILTRCRLSFFRRNAPACIATVLRRPHIWWLALRSSLKLVRSWIKLFVAASPSEDFRLLSLAVAPNATRKGIGTVLVRSFEAAVPATCDAYCLHVLKTNTSAIRFYESLAFQCAGDTGISWKLRKELVTHTRDA
jgi:ribosomal protein S18 acetylase RimI-like enzyme